MSVLPQKLEVPVWNTGRLLVFERTEDVTQWAQGELAGWTAIQRFRNPRLQQRWDEQRNVFSQIANASGQLERLLQAPESQQKAQQVPQGLQNLRNALGPISQGTALTTEHSAYGYMAALAEKDADCAATLLIAWRTDASQILANMGPAPLDAIARLSIELRGTEDQNKAIDAYRSELASLKNTADKEISELRSELTTEKSRREQLERDHNQYVSDRDKAWSDLLTHCGQDWKDLKKVYDEKLSLLAPTEYWRSRARWSIFQAFAFSGAFAAVLAALLDAFVKFGVDRLNQVQPGVIWPAVLPIIIPAFAGIWVLRILGRQLSEYLMILKDARERETLVKTFLALMRDETTGKAVVKEEDRVLILQALFRQSRVTAADDSPPIGSAEAVFRALRGGT